MKTLRLFSALLGLASCALYAADTKTAPRTEVIFDHPENFTDIKDHDMPTDKGEAAILANIHDFVVDLADRELPPGFTMKITFTDIDLAGDFEPQRGAQWDDVRIVKEIYPPAFKFTYSVMDPAGKVVKQGSENIRDLDFQTRITLDREDPLHYEKDILRDWLSSTVRNLKKG